MADAPAPAAAPQQQPSQPQQKSPPPPESKADAKEPKAPPPAAEQSQEDSRELWKRAVKGKSIKHKGTERQLEELDPDEATEMIRRGFGASELVSEAKKTREQAEQVLSLKKAIAEGDDDAALQAIYELGGDRGIKLLDKLRTQMAQQQEEVEQMTPRERAAREEAERAKQELTKYQREKAEREAAEAKKQDEIEAANTKRDGMAKVSEVLKLTKGWPVEKGEMVLPFVARAWREAIVTGGELGRDVPPEAIIKRAEQLFRQHTSGFYSALSPVEQFEFLGEEAVEALSRELVRRRRGAPAAASKPAGAAPKKSDGGRELILLGDPRYLMW